MRVHAKSLSFLFIIRLVVRKEKNLAGAKKQLILIPPREIGYIIGAK